MLEKIRAAQTDIEQKNLLKKYLVENSKSIRDGILTGLLGKHSPQDVAEELSLDYTTLYKALTGARKTSGFSFPLSKFGDFCRVYLKKSAQYILFKEERPIELSILMSKVAETLLAVDDEKRRTIAARAKELLKNSTNTGFMTDADYVILFKARSNEVCQDLGVSTCERNNHVHIQCAGRELSRSYQSTGPLSFTTVLAASFRYDIPVDYLLLKDYVSQNKIALRNGSIVKDKNVRKIISIIEQLPKEAKLQIIADILKEAM